MALNGNGLGDEIYAALGLDSTLPDAATKDAVKTTWEKIGTAIVAHLVNNMEINGLKVTLDMSLADIFGAGVPVPMDGGAVLQLAWKAITAGGLADNATQNNDGTGLIQ